MLLKLLFITRNMPPLLGGMERLNYRACLELQKQFEVAVCGPSGVGGYLADRTVCSEIPSAPLWKFLTICQWQSWRMAMRFKPDIVYSGSGLTAPAALFAGKRAGARTICYLHGLDIITDHPLYRSFFLPAIRRFDLLLLNSNYTASLAEKASIPGNKLKVLHPGVELPDLNIREQAGKEFRARFGLGNRPMLLSVGRITERKGLAPFIRNVMPEIIRIFPDIYFAIIGDEASMALKHQKGVISQVQSAIRSIMAEDNIALLGSVNDEILSQAYFAADTLVFPVLNLPGDIEGFGMVAVEAAAHGLSTVAFKVGGVSDAIHDGVSGQLIDAGDYPAMTRRIIELIQSKEDQTRIEKSRSYAEKLSWNGFGDKLRKHLVNVSHSLKNS
jgi:phosphatidyl-myo-inositol dimannoside synthase